MFLKASASINKPASVVVTMLRISIFANAFVALSGAAFLLFESQHMALSSSDFITTLRYLLIALFLLLLSLTLILFYTMKKYHWKMLSEIEVDKSLIISMKSEVERLDKMAGNLTKLYNNLIEYDNMKTEFFSNVSHEFKTPLSIILGSIQLIESKITPTVYDQSKTYKHLEIIKHNCFRLLRLINNILDITRLDSGYVKTSMTNCNIVYLVEEITQSVVPYAEQKGLILEFDTETEEVITAVDIDKIERIILNLLSNAIKFTPSGGKVSVNIYDRDNEVFISIKDTGCGIPKNMQLTVFERFRQVNSSLTKDNEGSGIGLSLVKSFVELHGGNIKLTSEENNGSEFLIALPVKLCESDQNEAADIHNNPQKIIDAINIEFSDIYSIAS